MFQSVLVLFWFSQVSTSFADVMNYRKTEMLVSNSQNDYFGHSILLQRGDHPIAIVGAPKEKNGKIYKCDLKSRRCENDFTFPGIEKGILVADKTGAFFGASLDGADESGGEVIMCAPRFLSSDWLDYKQRGKCVFIENSTNDRNTFTELNLMEKERDTVMVNRQHYYDAWFAQSGFSMSYEKSDGEILFGVPGKKGFNGAMSVMELQDFQIDLINIDFSPDDASYAGYAVSSGKFSRNPSETFYVMGAPRGSYLKGQVTTYKDKRGKNIVQDLLGEEVGSYFGASLLVLRRNNGDDLLVGAPMFSGSTWDEGRVYYYKNNGNGFLEKAMVLKTNRPQPGARFGTALAALGDIDFDSYPDVAIGAPYEDSGVGAVYIFYGTSEGFSADNFNRITPSTFRKYLSYPPAKILSFGSTISRGNDIDSDLHNEFAVGAYQTSQVFIFSPYEVIRMKSIINSSVEAIYTGVTDFTVTFCLSYKTRNTQRNTIPFEVTLSSNDTRVAKKILFQQIISDIEKEETKCFTEQVNLNVIRRSAEPLAFVLTTELADKFANRFLIVGNEKRLSIPVVRGCGPNTQCQVDLVLSVVKSKDFLIFGVDKELVLNISVQNKGPQPAFQTYLQIDSLKELNLIHSTECNTIFNGSHNCNFDEITAVTPLTKTMRFDLNDLQPTVEKLSLNFNLTSSGLELNPDDNIWKLDFPVILQNNPYVVVESKPEIIFLKKMINDYEINHQFSIGNEGPGPVRFDLTVFLPAIFHIESIETKGLNIACKVDETPEIVQSHPVINNPNNKTQLYSCLNHEKCNKISCLGDYLYKNSDLVKISLKMLAKIEAGNIDADGVTFASLAFFNNSTQDIFVAAFTTIYKPDDSIPIWIIAIATGIGLLFLAIVIMVLIKLHFFQRIYKEKLINEQMEESFAIDDGEPEEVFENVAMD